MARDRSSPTISLRERSLRLVGSEERLPKWLTLSALLHTALIACMFAISFMPSSIRPAPPVYTVDLIGGEKIGRTNFGTETAPAQKKPERRAEETTPTSPPPKKEQPEKPEKTKTVEKMLRSEEKIALTEKKTKEPVKTETAKNSKTETKSEPESADSVRERLIQTAANSARSRTETAQKTSKGETLSSGAGEGEGAASLGVGGRGGAGVVKGMDFIIYQNRMLSTIKDNWAWVGQRTNLKVVVHFGIRENGEIVGLKIVQPSGDATYDESVLRAVKKSSPLPVPPDAYRKDFADVELTFRPRDLGA
jgi:colicin import membrane protein